MPEVPSAMGSATGGNPAGQNLLRLGLIPERDIYQQRAAYRALGDYLAPKLGVRVELVTNSSYRGVLDDFADRKVDVAFLGSLVAALAMDRHDARVLLKSQSLDGNATYAGTVFVLEDSPAKSFTDLGGKTLGAVRTTTAGPLFPVYLMATTGMLEESAAPRFVWSGTHDDVIREVVAGRLDAGAVKDLRLDAYLRDHPEARVRRLATSPRVPDNALLARKDCPEADRLRAALLAMADDAGGAEILAKLGLRRFVACDAGEYSGLYDLIERVGPRWAEVGIDGPPPERPKAATAPGGQ